MKIRTIHITIGRVQALQNSINWLSKYTTPTKWVRHIIGPNVNTEEVARTKALQELGRINARREELINFLMSEKS